MGRAGVFDTKSGKLKRVACKLSQKWRFLGKYHAGGILPRFGESRRFLTQNLAKKIVCKLSQKWHFWGVPRRGYFTEVWGEPVFFNAVPACSWQAEKNDFFGEMVRRFIGSHICLDTSCVTGGPLRKESMCS